MQKIKGSLTFYPRQVSQDEAKEFAKKLGMYYVEVSAKTGENIKKLFDVFTFSLIKANN